MTVVKISLGQDVFSLPKFHFKKIRRREIPFQKGVYLGYGFQKGNIPWVKGKKVPQISDALKRAYAEGRRTGFEIGKLSYWKGKKMSEEHRKNLSLSHKGQKSRMKGNHFPKEFGEKISKALIGRKLSEEQIRKCLKKHPKSSLELKFENIVSKLRVPYTFVGNGDVLIGRKCPDFINTNGEKIAVEVYYKRHKEMIGQAKGKGLKNWKSERTNIFNKYGWKLLFFDETQVNEAEIQKQLGGDFYSGR